MKQRLTFIFFGTALVTLCSSWGFFAHRRINRLAVFSLPKSMAVFYDANIGYITEHAIDADKRRYVDSLEAPRHYLNADHYGKRPFLLIPVKWKDAAKKYTEDTLKKYGMVPWEVQYQYYRLVDAFKRHDTTDILRTSANLGHYIADAHVPLHLTLNYNGQLSNQTGIHALWESRIPELFSDHYRLYAGKARYIDNPLNEAFKICRTSFKCVDSVLRLEKTLSRAFPPGKEYEMVKHGNKTVQDYSAAYSEAYQKALKGMVEKRMRSAILSVGSYWFSAWVDAGQPDLNKLIEKPLHASAKQRLQAEASLFKGEKR